MGGRKKLVEIYVLFFFFLPTKFGTHSQIFITFSMNLHPLCFQLNLN